MRSARRSPPAARTRPAPRCTSASSPAATRAGLRRAPTRSSRPASSAWWSPRTIRASRPRRVVSDSEPHLPVTSQLVRSAAESPVIVICSRAASRTSTQALVSAGVEVITVSGGNEVARIEAGLDELGARDIQSLLVEGGPHLAGAFIDAGEVDELRVFVAPIIAGGRQARPAVEG